MWKIFPLSQYTNENDILKRSYFYAGMKFQLSYEEKWRAFGRLRSCRVQLETLMTSTQGRNNIQHVADLSSGHKAF